MAKTIETTVYTFDELSDKSKEVARNWWREALAGDNNFAEPIYSDAVEVAKLFGLEISHAAKIQPPQPAIFWSGFSSQGDGASFEGTYHHKPGALEAVKAFAPKDEKLHAIAATLEDLGPLGFAITQRGHYCHENMMIFESLEHDENGNEYPEWNENRDKTASEALRYFALWIYHQLELAYEFEMSNESIDENLTLNEYTFTIDGKRFG